MICPNCNNVEITTVSGVKKCVHCGFRHDDLHLLKIKEMFAFVAVDKDGNEGVPCIDTPEGPMPLMGADVARANSFFPIARHLAKTSKIKIRFVKFTNRVDLDEF